MKKIIACIASAVMLAACFAASVNAEQDGAQNPGDVRAEETTDATTTSEEDSSDPESTTGETTTPTEAPEPQFSFQNHDGQSLTVEWNAEDFSGESVTVDIGGTNCGTYSDSTFRVSLSGLTPGTYTMTYRLSNGETVTESQPVYVGGSLNISMTVRLSGNRVTAQLRDSYNRPVAGCNVNLLFNNARQETETSDADGNVTFGTALPSDLSVIVCTADNFTSNFIHYTGCTASLEGDVVTPTTTTTTTQATTSATTASTPSSSESSESESSSTASTTTVTTYEMIQGAGTTAVVGDQIAVNVSFDTQVAASFGYSTADFAARARLLLSESAYTSLVGQSGSVLMMQAETSSAEVTDAMISQAINGESAYSRFDAEKTLRVPVELSLHLINSAQGIDTIVPMPGEEVTVQLPVPSAMNDEDKYQLAVAFLDESGISRIADATVEDGILSFQTTSFSAIAVLGFETDGTAASRGGFPTISIILIIVGVLMLVGAGVLLYFFFLRKPAPEDPEQPDGEGGTEDSGEDDVRQYLPDGPEGGAGTAEDEEAWEQAEESAEGEFPDTPESGVSLGSLINRPASEEIPTTRKKNPSDYDLDL